MEFCKIFIFLYGIYVCDAGYGIQPQYAAEGPPQDVEAPVYRPSYAKTKQWSPYSGTKTGYSGAKTGYSGTKTGYAGTKTGYSGTKTVYTGTKTSYSGTKTGYGGTKNRYSETKTWHTNSGSVPTFEEFQNNANMPYTEKCNPPCQNGGFCVDTDTCHCGPNFQGKACELEKKPCLVYPPLPMNSHRKCSNDECSITCMPGHAFPDGTSIANLKCSEGQWQPSRDMPSVPDCQPQCHPPCLNGGICLAVDTCQCPTDYRGLQCQYANVCDMRKVAFNGGYTCFGDRETFSCKLTCPPGTSYSTPPADLYTCSYATGVFTPQPIPTCVFEKVIVVTPNNHQSRFNHSITDIYYTKEITGGSYSKSSYGSHYDIDSAGALVHGGTQNQVIVVQDLTPKGGSCLSWAGVHYKTFDGKIYTFKSACEHVLVRDTDEHKYSISIKQGACKRQAYCPAEITIFLDEKPYSLKTAEDGSVLFESKSRLVPIPASLPGLRVSMPNDHVIVNLDTQGVTLTWDTNNLILIEGTVKLWNNTEGLCGTLDGNPENDLMTREGTIATTKTVMASSWQVNKIGVKCESNPSENNACASLEAEDVKTAQKFCNKVFSKDKFRKCSKAMDVSMLLEACQWDFCACTTSMSPEECACSTVLVYAKECLRHGVEEMRNWRDSDTCPMQCPDGKIYQYCGPSPQPSCAFPESKEDNATCVEGCFCPKGLLLEAGKCIEKNECPCRLRSKGYKPGSVIPKDCNTCTCQAGQWTCTSLPCGARCSAVGDPHYTTFDGLRYDFMGRCTYELVRTDNFTVEVENAACSEAISAVMNLLASTSKGMPSCTKAVNIDYGGVSIHMKKGNYILINGKEVATLPVHVGDVLIRTASSLFVIVQLPNGVDIWWDGNTRVYVDVPPEFRKRTKGLCGTFNENQKDDFLTPENDIEQSVHAFANKWKTREFCKDLATEEPEHPCTTHVDAKETAEMYCGKLKSKVFEECHWHVEVAPYYAMCMYDMCACSAGADSCLCAPLAEYALACAAAGVLSHWREQVHECALSCTGGQEYTVCGDSCRASCSDVALSERRCKPKCVEGCACPNSQVLDANGVCVPVGMCPCYHKGMKFDAGYKEVRAGRRERELCTCVGARWACEPATPTDIQNYPPAEDLRTNCSATHHQEFTTCQIAEPLTCKNMHLPPTATTTECRPGCQCKKGYVLDMSSKKCVLPTSCPCHHGGRSYPDGHTMKENCNTCECKSGNWSCTQRKCAGVCAAWGDSHIESFDGTEFDFEGVCTYLLVKGCMDAKDEFDVEIQNVPCGTTGATCSKSLTLKVGGNGNEEIVSLTKYEPLPDISKLKRIKMRVAGAFVFLDVPSLGVTLQWDREMRVYVRLESMWHGRVKGLCGNYNGDSRDDFLTPTGGVPEASALVFAHSWKLKQTCPKPQPAIDHCKQRPERKDWALSTCGLLKRAPFSQCHTEVPVTAALEACVRDACACDAGGDCACACAALAHYALRCAERGVVFNWRTPQLCPMQCDGECSNYDGCMSPCPLETCDNMLYYADMKTVCEKDTCVEGCKPKKLCPEGQVYKNGTFKECVPRSKCKPLCMTLKNGTDIFEGDVIEEDNCHTCRCSKNEKICTGQPCATDLTIPTTGLPATRAPRLMDEPLKCVSGWTHWINRGPPEANNNGESEDNEPLPKPNELKIGSPMCKQTDMTQIECRTTVNHQSAKDTGLNVECSLERGLVCKETGNTCPDFEIRVYCDCGEEPFQCLDSTHPNHPHPTDCGKFYECTPGVAGVAGGAGERHAVLKSCAEGLMYNPTAMVCDWPAVVVTIRPECRERNETRNSTATTVPVTFRTWATVGQPKVTFATTAPTKATWTTPVTNATSATSKQTASSTTATTPTSTAAPRTTPSQCVGSTFFKKCAYKCDKMCDHFKKTMQSQGKCLPGEKCVDDCVDERVGSTLCDFGSRWRDRLTCVPISDCPCYADGQLIKPGGVTREGCVKCQCLDNEMHCDSSDCVSLFIPPQGPTHQPMISIENLRTTFIPPTNATERTTTEIITTFASTTKNIVTTKAPTTSTTEKVVTTHVPATVTTQVPTTMTTEKVVTTHVPATATTEKVVTTIAPLIIKSTVTPPPDCKLDGYKDLLWGDEPPKFSASSSANDLFAPQYAILNGHPSDTDGGSWNPATSDGNQYIQVTFPQPEPIYGVKMQGSPIYDQYVTSYDVMYGDDGNAFSTIDGADGKPKVFLGPIDHENALTQMFNPPIEAKVLRIRPLTWHDEIAVRFEVIGCQETSTSTKPDYSPNCTEPLGLVGSLPVHNIEVSSNADSRAYLRLDEKRGWKPLYSTPGEWIMFDFQSPRNITGVKTAGGPTGWVSAYNVMYTSDLNTFNPVVDEKGAYKVFPGNFDKVNVVVNEFQRPIHARYLKLLPLKWKESIEMRIEPIGCFVPYEEVATTPLDISTTTVSSECTLCPGIQETDCDCTGDRFYDGDNCVSRDQCPCVEAFMTYAVGSTFRGPNCDECVCKLGGVTNCKPGNKCICADNLLPKLSLSTCECVCEYCPNGTKICPTSQICLALDKWCDGLQDCPDDEKDCTTTTATTTVATTIEPTVVTTVAPTAAATQPTTTVTTPKPVECPPVQCPPHYTVRVTPPRGPVRPRQPYLKYQRRTYTKTGSTNSVYTKTTYTKTSYSKGGFGGLPAPPQKNQAFSLEKPTLASTAKKQECVEFKCVPNLPPFRPGQKQPLVICSTPICPPKYALRLETTPHGDKKCPQYICMPPPERPVYCNMTGKTVFTFDGTEYKAELCFHILARDNKLDAWTILVRKKCRIEGCQNELLIRQDDQLILIKPNLMIEYDNYEYTVQQTSLICFQKNSFDVDQLGNGIVVKSRKYNFTVLYSRDGDVKIGVAKSLMGTVDGLCGTFDGDATNERRLPTGRVVPSIAEFTRAWAKPGLPPNACETKVISVNKQKKIWDLCDVITKEPFTQCGKHLKLENWRNICLEKVCTCSELVSNGTNMPEEQCRCLVLEQLVAECLAADAGVDLASWRMSLNCPAECPPPLVHYDCYRRRCEPSCSGRGGDSSACPLQPGLCSPGCYCPPGGLLRQGDTCIPPYQCTDCSCTGVGDSAKYTTFEKEDLPFSGNCTYLASRGKTNQKQIQYQVFATNGPCEDNAARVCTNTVHIVYEKNVVHVTRHQITKQLVVTIGKSAIFKYPLKKDWITLDQVNSRDVSVKLTKAHVEVTVSQASMEFNILVPSSVYGNKTEGLCGVCAGESDALVTSQGTVTDDIQVYGLSWKATPAQLDTLELEPQMQCDDVTPPLACLPPPPEQNPCYVLFNADKFGACHALVDPHPFVEWCSQEACEEASQACASVQRYVAECRKHAVCIHWRTHLCPYTCEAPLVYRPCVDCVRTCDNYDKYAKNPKLCKETPVEGCFCPEGKVRVNNTCIEPSKCFPCDADKQHYAGDQWQTDECTTCSCARAAGGAGGAGGGAGVVSCVRQSCSTPVCGVKEDLVQKPKAPGTCCADYICVPKPKNKTLCKEAKKMTCGFGQVLKQKTDEDDCVEYTCECKAASECERIETEVEMIEAGVERVVDTTGCCPRVQLLCRPALCPPPPACPVYHHLTTDTTPEKCCPKYQCELPKDKCIVKLEWEASPGGGEKTRTKQETVLKDVGSSWVDGPCRSCSCPPPPRASPTSSLAPAVQCTLQECPPVVSTDSVIVEPRMVPYSCCPTAVSVACRDGDNVYKVGENWTSSVDPCESYRCVQQGNTGKLEKTINRQTCDRDCLPGWKYFESASPATCCGLCRPVACIVDGRRHSIGEHWTSLDFCTNYTCVQNNGTLQVQSSEETCPDVSEDERKQFVINETKVQGKCCRKYEYVACRVGDLIYKENETWSTSDPCRNASCVRASGGALTQAWRAQGCVACPAHALPVPQPGLCCARCVMQRCQLGNESKPINSTWQSADNCTLYKCEQDGDSVIVNSSPLPCHTSEALSTCVPVGLGGKSVGAVRARLGAHGACANTHALPRFKECRGTCSSGTIYNNQTGSHDSRCECCQAVQYEPLTVLLSCEDGSSQLHNVASPVRCACKSCGLTTLASHTKTSGVKGRSLEEEDEFDIPQMYARFKEQTTNKP